VPARVHAVGDAPAVEPSHVGRSAVDANALLALTTLGFTKREAQCALDVARECLDDNATLDAAIRAALRHCPR
jgi:Holliday junction resolvasome RuvABC DNA-binding subunit